MKLNEETRFQNQTQGVVLNKSPKGVLCLPLKSQENRAVEDGLALYFKAELALPVLFLTNASLSYSYNSPELRSCNIP